MAGERQAQRIRREFIALAHRGLGVQDLFEVAARKVQRVVPFEGACWVTIDPATLLVTGYVSHGPFETQDLPLLAHHEYAAGDALCWATLMRERRPTRSLREAVGGPVEHSERYRNLLLPKGLGDELRLVFAEQSKCWGAAALVRERARASFSPADTALLSDVTGYLAAGLRRAILIGAASAETVDGPGLVLLRDDDSIDAMTPAAEQLLAPLMCTRDSKTLPVVVYVVASRAREIADHEDCTAGVARSRVQTTPGCWLVLHGSRLETSAGMRTAIVVETASPPEVATLLMDSYQFTPREREIVSRVIQGLSTEQIAKTLYLSPYTIQDHLKAIFDKVGVHSRRELIAHMFFRHYAPRIAHGDNLAANGWFRDQHEQQAVRSSIADPRS